MCDFTLETLKETVVCPKIRRKLTDQKRMKSTLVNKWACWSYLQEQGNSWKSLALKSSTFSQSFVCFSQKAPVLCCLVGRSANWNLRGGSPEDLVTKTVFIIGMLTTSLPLLSDIEFCLFPCPDCRPRSFVGYHGHSASRR